MIVLDKGPPMLPSMVKVQCVFIMCNLLESHHILTNVFRFLLFVVPSTTVQNKTCRTVENFEFLITGFSNIWGYHSIEHQNYKLNVCDAVYFVSMFRRNLQLPSARMKMEAVNLSKCSCPSRNCSTSHSRKRNINTVEKIDIRIFHIATFINFNTIAIVRSF